MSTDITLLSMAPSGDAMFVRDDAGTWSVDSSRRRREVHSDMAYLSAAKHDFTWVDRTFVSPEALEAFVQERAAECLAAMHRRRSGNV